MKISVGYEFVYSLPQPTPMILTVSIHYSRASDIIIPDFLTTDPPVPVVGYRDGFGNWCNRLVAPAGKVRIKGSGEVRDSGIPDMIVPSAQQHGVQDLPEETLVFLLGSRYCETDLLSEVAWNYSGRCNADGHWCRSSATMFMTESSSIICVHDVPGRRGKRTTSASESAGTSRT